MFATNYALYYPYITINNTAWLKSASLFWDRIYRIVPDTCRKLEPHDCIELYESNEIGIPISPQNYSKPASCKFLEEIELKHWQASAFTTRRDNDNYSRLHKDKVDVVLRELINREGVGKDFEEWTIVPNELASLYMLYLANFISESNNLSLITDLPSAWTGSTYFKYDNSIEPKSNINIDRIKAKESLLMMVIQGFVPQNISEISAKDILEFRNKRKDKRTRFVNAISAAEEKLAACSDKTILRDMIVDLDKDINNALQDYKRSMNYFHVAGWGGIKSIFFPSSALIIADATSKDWMIPDFNIASYIHMGCIALGIICSLIDYQKKKTNNAASDYSYLFNIQSQFSKKTKFHSDNFRKLLYEFIYD